MSLQLRKEMWGEDTDWGSISFGYTKGLWKQKSIETRLQGGVGEVGGGGGKQTR